MVEDFDDIDVALVEVEVDVGGGGVWHQFEVWGVGAGDGGEVFVEDGGDGGVGRDADGSGVVGRAVAPMGEGEAFVGGEGLDLVVGVRIKDSSAGDRAPLGVVDREIETILFGGGENGSEGGVLSNDECSGVGGVAIASLDETIAGGGISRYGVAIAFMEAALPGDRSHVGGVGRHGDVAIHENGQIVAIAGIIRWEFMINTSKLFSSTI